MTFSARSNQPISDMPQQVSNLIRYRIALVIYLACCWLGPSASVSGQIRFENYTERAGIDFVHTDGSSGKYYLVESMSAGVALLDYDIDGDLDIYFLNGAPIDSPNSNPATNALYRNDGGFRFTNVTKEAGVDNAGMSLGVATADFDNDGLPDIYVNNYAGNCFYRNNGDGTFDDIAKDTQTACSDLIGGGVCFLDIENDGDLDLYVANYIKFDLENHRPHIHKGLPAYPSPMSFQPEPDRLFRNVGDGTFEDWSNEAGVLNQAGRGMGVLAFDFDADGDQDIFVANDTQENHLLVNDGAGRFTEDGLFAGLAYDFRGKAQASMGVDIADFNGDGLQDLVVTSFLEEFTTIYQNQGAGVFEDATLRSGTGEATFPHVTWGLAALDADNDTIVDLVVGTGDLDDRRTSRGGASTATGFRVADVMLRGDGRGRFSDLKADWGEAARTLQSTRGLVAGDLDNDGRVDIVALGARGRPAVLRNTTANTNNWISLSLVGDSQRSAIGSRVTAVVGGKELTRIVLAGRSYQSCSSQKLCIGVGGESSPIDVAILWPDGSRSAHSIATNTQVVVLHPSLSPPQAGHFDSPDSDP
ncbi:MAG TPA: hypothetical protein DDW52_02035 [Planctomycetaceae bacterium]|nr:hypothetical protein [Planctomycetaceae bacterium]